MASTLLLATLGTACAEASPNEVEQLGIGATATPVVVGKISPTTAASGHDRGTVALLQVPPGIGAPLEEVRPTAPSEADSSAGVEGAGQIPPPPSAPHVSVAGSVSAPPPPTEAPIAPDSGILTPDQLVAVFAAAGWPASEYPRLLALTMCESSHKSGAYNSGGPFYSLFQVLEDNYIHFGIDPSLWYDPVTNATVARWLWETGGYSHWPNC